MTLLEQENELASFSRDYQARPVIRETIEELSLLDLIAILGRTKKGIALATLVATIVTAGVTLIIPNRFQAEAVVVLPAQQSNRSGLSILAASGLLSATDLGVRAPADVYMGILKSRTLSDSVIERFHLQSAFKTTNIEDAENHLRGMVRIENGKDGLLRIVVTDTDPKLAAAIANGIADQLHAENSKFAVTEASQRRLFFEHQLRDERDALAEAESHLKATQESTGLIAPPAQEQAVIQTGSQLRAQIASLRVQLASAKMFETDNNPQVQVLEQTIGSLQNEIGRVEAGPKQKGMEISGGSLPQTTLDYARKLRDVKYHEALVEMISRQFESARLDEAQQTPLIQVIDPARVPRKSSEPRRGLITLAAAAVSLFASSLYVLLGESWSMHVASYKRREAAKVWIAGDEA